MPPRPYFVTDVIPQAIEALQRRQKRIENTVAAGGYVDDPESVRVLDLCKQILETDQQ